LHAGDGLLDPAAFAVHGQEQAPSTAAAAAAEAGTTLQAPQQPHSRQLSALLSSVAAGGSLWQQPQWRLQLPVPAPDAACVRVQGTTLEAADALASWFLCQQLLLEQRDAAGCVARA
jgi:hypothetical protein